MVIPLEDFKVILGIDQFDGLMTMHEMAPSFH